MNPNEWRFTSFRWVSKLHRQTFARMAKRVLPDGWQPVDVHPRDMPGWQAGDPLPEGYHPYVGRSHNNKSSSTWHERRASGHNNRSSSTWHERRADGNGAGGKSKGGRQGNGAGGGSKGGRRSKVRRKERPGLGGIFDWGHWASAILTTVTGMVRL